MKRLVVSILILVLVFVLFIVVKESSIIEGERIINKDVIERLK